ncbi:DUF4097 family beta strand repeat protein [Nocardiopsis sp. CNT-189]|uniref:DUF4097 family beta strand repeat-containing protein n=1 Tax=Nocardiopsis oceanisediminis TaxID=2816862 RepID=UPI003B2BE300
MPVFDTPDPVTVDLTLVAGSVQISAGDRTETAVEVRPRDEAKEADKRAAEQVEVAYAGGRLEIRDPQPSGLGRVVGRKGMVDITVELPAGSRLQASGDFGTFRCDGRLGAAGIALSNGNIAVDLITGNAELSTGYGWIRAGEIGGSATVKSSGGAITLGTVTGDLKANSAHGDITADRTPASVTARTTHGSVRLGRVSAGRIDVGTSYGELEIGVREGTAAWLDAVSKKGVVRSSLEAAADPAPTEETVEVRARSVHGDITVRRA